MRVLFNVPPAIGHMTASIAVAQELQRAGHTVAFLCAENRELAELALRYAGLDAACLDGMHTSRPRHAAALKSSQGAGLVEMLRDDATREQYYHHAFVDGMVPQVPVVLDALTRFAPDVFCNEGISLAGAIAAELTRRPWVSIQGTWDVMAPPEYPGPDRQDFRMLAEARAEVIRSFGVSIEFEGACSLSPLTNLVFSVEQLTPMHPGVPRATTLIGPVRRTANEQDIEFPWDRLDPTRPLVYVSPGSLLEFDDDAAADIVRIVADAGADLVYVRGKGRAIEVTEHAIFVPFAPQLMLLQRASVFVTHGGAGSVMEGLLAGVPLVVLPVAFDQPLNAWFVERAGLGRVVDPWSWSAAAFAGALHALLRADGSQRVRARAFRTDVQIDGAVRAAELVASQDRAA